MSGIYLDYNATAPLRPGVVDAMREALREPTGNASSVHWAGELARRRLRAARAQVERALGVTQGSVVFTSGGTEANASAVSAALAAGAPDRDELVVLATEHASLLGACAVARARGARVVELRVDAEGRLDPDEFEAALSARTALASVMWVNNETGVVQPVRELAARAHAHGVPFHTDAVQALGKLELALDGVPIAYASFSAHKIGGPMGIGALYVAPDPARDFSPLLIGGGQEQGRRAGTENVLGIVGFGAACDCVAADLEDLPRLRSLRDGLYDALEKHIPGICRNGSTEHAVAAVLNLSFPGTSGAVLVEALDLEGIAVSSGSACHAGSSEPSHVLLAMGHSRERSAAALRISLGWGTRSEDVGALSERLPQVVARAREARR